MGTPSNTGGSAPLPSPLPPPFSSLHDHHHHHELQPQRGSGEDYDMLSGWARSLSVSPRLYPTTYGNESVPSAGMGGLGLDSPSFGPSSSYRGLSGSPVLAPIRRESHLNVGTGLSPVLGPTHLGRGPPTSTGGGGAATPSSLMASGVGSQDYSYASAFGAQYQDSPPSETLNNHHHSPHETVPSRPASIHSLSQSPALGALSFSNVDHLASLSPPLPQPPNPLSSTGPRASTSASASLPFQTSSSAMNMPSPSHYAAPPPPAPATVSTPAATAEEEDPRIRAYAKLEFPTFDIYIQKLSVIIGRRPAAAVLAAAASVQAARSPSAPSRGGSLPAMVGTPAAGATPAPLNDARGEGVKLEDFVMGMEVGEPTSKGVEEKEKEIKAEPEVEQLSVAMVPQLSLTPSSPKPTVVSGAAVAPVVDAFAEFLKSSPPVVTAPTGAGVEAESDVPPLALSPAPATNNVSNGVASTSTPAPVPSPSVVAAPSPAPTPTAPTPAPAAPSPAPAALPPGFLTDIDLGPIRAVSRQHARLYFDYEIGGWAIEVLGRNGVVVDGKWKAKGEKEGMSARTKIQIAERVFFFVLPTIDPPSTLHNALGSTSALAEADDDSESDLSSLDSDLSSQSSRSPHLRARSASRNPLLDGDGDSSSLSELSSSDVELSPLQNPLDEYGLPVVPGLSLAGGMVAGKRVEMLQAVRSGGKGMGMGGGGGKGKAAQRRGGKGKGKMLPPKRPRRDSWAYDSEEEDEEERHGYGGYGGRYNEYDEELEDDEGHFAEEDEYAMVQSPPKRNLELKRAVESKTPSFARALAMKGPPSAVGGKNAGQLANKKRKHDINKIVIKRKDSLGTPPLPPLPPAPQHAPTPRQAAKAPAKAPATAATKMPKRQKDELAPSSNIASAAAAFANPLLLPPLPGGSGASSSTSDLPLLPADGSTSALSAANLPPLPGVDAPSETPGIPGVPAKRPRGRPPKNGVSAKKPKKKHLAAGEGGSPAVVDSLQLPSTAPSTAAASPSSSGAIDPALAGPSTTTTSSSKAAAPAVVVYGPWTAEGVAPIVPRAAPYAPAPMPAGPPPDRAAPDNLLAKPPYTYASLIAQAVMDSPGEKLTLHGIYDWVQERWPYFKDNQQGWQNSIRHNLTIARGFLKLARAENEPGKGSFWTLDHAQREGFDGHVFRKKVAPKQAALPGATPASTSTAKTPTTTTANGQASAAKVAPAKPSSTASTPRPAAIPAAPAARPAGAAAPAPTPSPSLSAPLPIIIAPIPDSYVRPPPPTNNGAPPDELTAALLKDPPIVLHEGKLILNPSIFAHLSKEQLDNLQDLPASQALQILQAYVVQHFKEKMRRMATEKAEAAAKAATVAASGEGKGKGDGPNEKKAAVNGSAVASGSVAIDPKIDPALLATTSNGTPSASSPKPASTSSAPPPKPAPLPPKPTPPPPPPPTVVKTTPAPSPARPPPPPPPPPSGPKPSVSPAPRPKPPPPPPPKPATRSGPPLNAPTGPRNSGPPPGTPTGPKAQRGGAGGRVTRQQVASTPGGAAATNKRKLSESVGGLATPASKTVKR